MLRTLTCKTRPESVLDCLKCSIFDLRDSKVAKFDAQPHARGDPAPPLLPHHHFRALPCALGPACRAFPRGTRKDVVVLELEDCLELGFGFWVSGFGFPVSGFGLRSVATSRISGSVRGLFVGGWHRQGTLLVDTGECGDKSQGTRALRGLGDALHGRRCPCPLLPHPSGCGQRPQGCGSARM